MNDEARDSQQTSLQDSGLQTPQPDQPHPPVSNQRDDEPEDSPPIIAGPHADEDSINSD